MRKLDKLKEFLNDLKDNKTIIFNYEKLSSFERELFLSIQNILKEKYNYDLDGLTQIHLMNFIDNVKDNSIHIDEDINYLITSSFSLYALLTKRNISLGYGESESEKIIENENLEKFIDILRNYIKTYEELN